MQSTLADVVSPAKIFWKSEVKDNNDILTIPLSASIPELKDKIKETIKPPPDLARHIKEIHISPIMFEKERDILKLEEDTIVGYHQNDDDENNIFNYPYCFKEDTLIDN